MANYSNLHNIIDQVVRTNGKGDITGANLNQTLQQMVTDLGANYQYAGVAVPSTNPGSPDQNVFYIATIAGTYSFFNGIVLPKGITVLRWNGSWSSTTLYTVDTGLTPESEALVQSGTVFEKFKFDGGPWNVSAHFPAGGPNNDGIYTLEYILNNANTYIPANIRIGGMSIKFVQSSSNKYVQVRCMAQNFTTDVTQWQGIDDEPTAGSDNLVKSGGVESVLSELETIDETEFSMVAILTGKFINTNGYIYNNPDYSISDVYEIDRLNKIENIVAPGVAAIAFLKYPFINMTGSYLDCITSTGTAANPQTIYRKDITIPNGTKYFMVCAQTSVATPKIYFSDNLKKSVERHSDYIPQCKEYKCLDMLCNHQGYDVNQSKFTGPTGIGTWYRTDLFNLDYYEKIVFSAPVQHSISTPMIVIMDKDFNVLRTYIAPFSLNGKTLNCYVERENSSEKYVLYQIDKSLVTDTNKIVGYLRPNVIENKVPEFSYHMKIEEFYEPRSGGNSRFIASSTLKDYSDDEFLAIYIGGNMFDIANWPNSISQNTLNFFASHKINVGIIAIQGITYGVDNRAWGNDMAYNAVCDLYAYLQKRFSLRKEAIIIGTSMGGLTMGELAYKRPFPIRFCIGNGPAPGLNICWENAQQYYESSPYLLPWMRSAYGLTADGSEDSQFEEKSVGCDWFKMGVIGNTKVGFPNIYIYYGADDTITYLFGGAENYITIVNGLIAGGVRAVAKGIQGAGHGDPICTDTAIEDGVFEKELSFYVEPEE